MAAQSGALKVPLTAATSSAVGGVINLENPEGVDLIITRALLHVATKSDGAATVDIGVDDKGDTSDDALFDDVSVAATGLHDNLAVPDHDGDGGPGNAPAVLWPAGYHLVGTASADATGLEGHLYVEFIRV